MKTIHTIKAGLLAAILLCLVLIDPQVTNAQTVHFMAMSQMPVADQAFHAVIHGPAWKIKPSWYMVAKADRIINPDLERLYAKRAGSKVKEVAGASHAVFASHPREVADLIIEAATGKK